MEEWTPSPPPGLEAALESEWWNGWCLGLLHGVVFGAGVVVLIVMMI